MQDIKEFLVYSILQKTEVGCLGVFTIETYINIGNSLNLGVTALGARHLAEEIALSTAFRILTN